MSLYTAEAEALKAAERSIRNMKTAEEIVHRFRMREWVFIEPPKGKDRGGAWNVWWACSDGWRLGLEMWNTNQNDVTALGIIQLYDLANTRGVISDEAAIHAKLDSASADVHNLRSTLRDRESTIKSLNDELHTKDAEIRRLEGILTTHNVSFGSEQGEVQ